MNKRTYLLFTISLFALSAVAQKSEKISRVLDYRPAPGQHINRLFPTPAMSTSYENALQWANEKLVDNKAMVGLGSFGGYVIVGFDHSIVNVPGEYDFNVLGNSMAGGAEPGVVMVCQDLNKNGKPDADEPWYELAGSEYKHAQTIHNYEITYYRPEGKKQNVRWTDNQGGEGAITHISFASQDYIYPIWIVENSYTLKGSKLRSNAVQNGSAWTLSSFDWGYADNHPNNAAIDKTGFNIDWAVDANGVAVHLDYIDFIKIHTGLLQEAGWLGETSTEVAGVVDLHPNAVTTGTTIPSANNIKISNTNNTLQLSNCGNLKELKIYNLQGMLLGSVRNSNFIELGNIARGVYTIKATNAANEQFTNKLIINN